MRTLVTGSRGFIGQAVVRHLLQNSDVETVFGISRSNLTRSEQKEAYGKWYQEIYGDITDIDTVEHVMDSLRPDVVFHLAGNPKTKLTDEDSYGFGLWDTNVTATQVLLACAPKGCRFVLASSATVYGDVRGACEESRLLAPTSLYGASKAAAEALVTAYTNSGDVNGVILRYIANVGPGSTHGLLHDLIRKVKSHYIPLDLLGDSPGSCKPFCHVSDTAAATVLAGLARNHSHLVYNVGPRDNMTVEQVALTVMKTVRRIKPIRWLGKESTWKGDNPYVQITNGRILSLGWVPMHSTSEEAVIAAVKELDATLS